MFCWALAFMKFCRLLENVHNSDQSAAEIFIRQAVPGLAVALAPLLIVTDLAGVSSLCKASLSGCCCL